MQRLRRGQEKGDAEVDEEGVFDDAGESVAAVESEGIAVDTGNLEDLDVVDAERVTVADATIRVHGTYDVGKSVSATSPTSPGNAAAPFHVEGKLGRP